MEFRTYFKHMESSPALLAYAEEKLLAPIEALVHKPLAAHLTISVENGLNRASCHVTGAHGLSVQVDCTDPASMYSCLDRLQDKLEAQLRRFKERAAAHDHDKLATHLVEEVQPADPYEYAEAEIFV